MQQVTIAPNPQIATIFQKWAEDWANEAQGDKKDTANKFHTVYNIAANMFQKGGEVDLQILHALFEDCKQKLENANAMNAKVKAALSEDDPRAKAIIGKITLTANDASHVVRYLGQLLKPSA
ncbi:hypothetical protein ACFFLZ_14080 [Photobacterium aphoticum]|uniref:Uncharacterized protein n=1 Tax=Photobacterium aphoticum TaxID=754436 RepID=A0A0J1GLV5_9GAMM|nr:hypothetical protein [Photobacterium aphoticum]KLV00444.1 hypothetical protein ABT58_12335 [Photobacterium aphoticum]PSU59790.1 hypothetical protein C9I90_02165 [Photobacterium aphoticum]GHA42311.1 hypothetical protein GCM10007086_14870 [Photobacterium aphoticum]